jgi:L-alanine-DL-glutamate epimerase-like enolase superfamily enzyme
LWRRARQRGFGNGPVTSKENMARHELGRLAPGRPQSKPCVGSGQLDGYAVFEKPISLTKDGYFEIPTGPGLGVTIRKDLYEKPGA